MHHKKGADLISYDLDMF